MLLVLVQSELVTLVLASPEQVPTARLCLKVAVDTLCLFLLPRGTAP